jgi:hypothetical protein
MSVGRESVSFGSVRKIYFGKPERRGGDVHTSDVRQSRERQNVVSEGGGHHLK